MSSLADKATLHTSDQIYDRQIRLWGASAQTKIMSTKVLYLHPSPLMSEVMKNLVLAGLSGCLMSDRKLATHDVQPMLFVDAGMVGSPVAEAMLPNVQELNPLATITSDTRSFDGVTADEFKEYNVIIADPTHLDHASILKLNEFSRANNSQLFLASSFGFQSCAFIDLGETHEWKKEVGKGELGDVVVEDFVTWSEAEAVDMKSLKNRFGEVPKR